MRNMLWVIAAACIATGCGNTVDLGDRDKDHDCPDRTGQAVLIAPQTNATTIHVGDPVILQWKELMPDRYTSMLVGGNFVISTNDEQKGDQSIMHYDFVAGMKYEFEAGWICDAASGGPQIPLVHFAVTAEP